MAFIPRKVFFVYEEIMVRIQLPESTVEHIEVLVRKVLSNLVYVFLRCYLLEDVSQIRVLEVSPRYSPIVVRI